MDGFKTVLKNFPIFIYRVMTIPQLNVREKVN